MLSSSLMPPDRKWMPGTAGGTELSMVCTVNLATSVGEAVGASSPAHEMGEFVQGIY